MATPKHMSWPDFHRVVVVKTLHVHHRKPLQDINWQPMLDHMDPDHEEVIAWHVSGHIVPVAVHQFLNAVFEEATEAGPIHLSRREWEKQAHRATGMRNRMHGLCTEQEVMTLVREIVTVLCAARAVPDQAMITRDGITFRFDRDGDDKATLTRI